MRIRAVTTFAFGRLTKSKVFLVAAVLGAMLITAPPAHGAPSNAVPTPAASPAASSPASDQFDGDETARAKEWLHRLQTGNVDHSQLDAQMEVALNPKLVKQLAQKFGPLGEPTDCTYLGQQDYSGDRTAYVYHVTFKSGAYNEILVLDKDGKIASIQLPDAQ